MFDNQLYKYYAKEVKKQTGYTPNVITTTELELGDIVTFKDNIITPISNIKTNFGYDFKVKIDNPKSSIKFASNGVNESDVENNVDVKVAKLNTQVNFTSNQQTYMNLLNVQSSRIDNQIALSRKMKEWYRNGDFKAEWKIITNVVRAGFAIIAISKGKGSSLNIDIEAQNIPIANGFDPNLGFKIKNKKGNDLSYFITQDNCTPLVQMYMLEAPKIRVLGNVISDKHVWGVMDFCMAAPIRDTIAQPKPKIKRKTIVKKKTTVKMKSAPALRVRKI